MRAIENAFPYDSPMFNRVVLAHRNDLVETHTASKSTLQTKLPHTANKKEPNCKKVHTTSKRITRCKQNSRALVANKKETVKKNCTLQVKELHVANKILPQLQVISQSDWLICIMQRVHFQIRVGVFNCQDKDFFDIVVKNKSNVV